MGAYLFLFTLKSVSTCKYHSEKIYEYMYFILPFFLCTPTPVCCRHKWNTNVCSVCQFTRLHQHRMWVNSLVPFELRIAKVTDNRVSPPPHLLLPPIIYMTVSAWKKKKKKNSLHFLTLYCLQRLSFFLTFCTDRSKHHNNWFYFTKCFTELWKKRPAQLCKKF